MQINQACLILKSRNISSYLKFFSDILDIEPDVTEETLTVNLNHFHIQFVQTSQEDIEYSHIEVKLQNIEDIKSRIDFFNFRNKEIALHVSVYKNQIDIIDFEKRKWCFKV